MYHTEYLEKNADPEYYKEIKRLKSKVTKAYNRRKLGVHCTEKKKQLSKQLLAAKKSAQEAFLKSILSKEDKCWSDFYKYVKRCKGFREILTPSSTLTDGSLQTRYELPIHLTVITRKYSAATATFFIYRVKKQAIHSPLILKQLGELKREGKTNQ